MSQFRESIHKHLVCTSFFYKPNRKNFCFKYTSKIKDKQTLNSAKQYTIQEKIESNFNTNENRIREISFYFSHQHTRPITNKQYEKKKEKPTQSNSSLASEQL